MKSRRSKPQKRMTQVKSMNQKFQPVIKKHVPKLVTVSYLTPEKKLIVRKNLTPDNFKKLQKKETPRSGIAYARMLPVSPEEQQMLDLLVIEKDYYSGAKYTRQVDLKNGKTIDFTNETGNGHIFYQRNQPEPRMNVYHNRGTGKKVTTNKKLQKKKIEWLVPERRPKNLAKSKGKKTVSLVNPKGAVRLDNKESDIEIEDKRPEENDTAKMSASGQLYTHESSSDSSSNDGYIESEDESPQVTNTTDHLNPANCAFANLETRKMSVDESSSGPSSNGSNSEPKNVESEEVNPDNSRSTSNSCNVM